MKHSAPQTRMSDTTVTHPAVDDLLSDMKESFEEFSEKMGNMRKAYRALAKHIPGGVVKARQIETFLANFDDFKQDASNLFGPLTEHRTIEKKWKDEKTETKIILRIKEGDVNELEPTEYRFQGPGSEDVHACIAKMRQKWTSGREEKEEHQGIAP